MVSVLGTTWCHGPLIGLPGSGVPTVTPSAPVTVIVSGIGSGEEKKNCIPPQEPMQGCSMTFSSSVVPRRVVVGLSAARTSATNDHPGAN